MLALLLLLLPAASCGKEKTPAREMIDEASFPEKEKPCAPQASAEDSASVSGEESAAEGMQAESSEGSAAVPSETPEETTEPVEPSYVRLLAIGDMLMHAGISFQLQQPDGTFNYSSLFENIQNDLNEADLAIVNNEVIFGGDELGPIGYPSFSVPTALGDEEIRCGFDVILGATNHTNDWGPQGIRNTLDYWEKHPEVTLLGLHRSWDDYNAVKVVERNGIRIAMLNLTYGLNIDGIPEEEGYLVELMTTENRYQISKKLQWANENADFVIVFPHWGEEYELTHNAVQQEWAEFFAEFGADLIIGSHTHTIQENEWVTAWNGNTAYCVYSLGNYVSLQGMTINMPGKMPKITLVKDAAGCRIQDVRNDYVLTWFNESLTGIRVYKMDQVTDEMISSHGVMKSIGVDFFDEMNRFYPMTREVLESLCK